MKTLALLLALLLCPVMGHAQSLQQSPQSMQAWPGDNTLFNIKDVAEWGLWYNITTNTTTYLNLGLPTLLLKIIVGTAGATSSIVCYDSDGGATNPILTMSTLAQTSLDVNAFLRMGLTCVTTGGTPANVTLIYR